MFGSQIYMGLFDCRIKYVMRTYGRVVRSFYNTASTCLLQNPSLFTLQKQKYIDFFQRKTDDSFLKCVLPTGVKDVLSNYHTTCFPSSEFLIPRLLNSKRSEARLGVPFPFSGTPYVNSTQTVSNSECASCI